jgi:hypothetical protein
LFFGEHDRSRRRALRAEVVNGVETGRERPKEAALRHAPPAREDRRRDVVDR